MAGNAIAATVKVRLITIASPKLIKVLIPCDTSFSKKNSMSGERIATAFGFRLNYKDDSILSHPTWLCGVLTFRINSA